MIEQRSISNRRAFIYALVIHGIIGIALAPELFKTKKEAFPEGQRVRVAFVYSPISAGVDQQEIKRLAPKLIEKPQLNEPKTVPQKPKPVNMPEPKSVPQKPKPVNMPEPKSVPQKPEPVKAPKPKPVPKKPEPVKAPKPKPVPKKPEPVKAPKPKPVPKKPEPVKAPEPKPVPKKPEPVKVPESVSSAEPKKIDIPPLLLKPDIPKDVLKKQKAAAQQKKRQAKKKDVSFDDIADALNDKSTTTQKRNVSSDFDDLGAMLEGMDSPSATSNIAAGAVRDIIKSRIVPNWNIPFTATSKDMVVHVSIRLQKNGALRGRPSIKPSPYDGNQVYERLKISTLQAIERTAPFTGLPEQHYLGTNGWNDVIISFTPKDVRR